MNLSLELIFTKSAVCKGLKIRHASSKSSKIYCPKQFSQNVWPFLLIYSSRISSVQSLSRVRLFATPRTAACQASLSITNSQSLFKLMRIESVMPSNHLILCCPFLLLPSVFPSIKDFFPVSWLLTSDGHSIGASASASVLPINIQG